MPRPSASHRSVGRWAAPSIAIALLAVYAPGWLRSGLLQGDLPGHLEAMRAYAGWIWPAPWGWDPRFLLGTPLGILYPPAFHWVGGGLGKAIGVEPAMRLIVLASVAVLPFAFRRAARGLGLRGDEAGWAAGAAVAVLCLPGRGLGGTLHQTFVAGNAANAFALPLMLAFLAELRPALGRPARWRRASGALAATLLSHFLMGLVGIAALAAYGLAGARRGRTARLGRAARIGVAAALLAAPFLLPFVVHLKDGSPDAIPFSPPPGAPEWGALAALVAAVAAGGRRARRGLLPATVALLVLYAFRGVVFPWSGEPPFRMEYHRFRLFLYLALVPAAVLGLGRVPVPRLRSALRAIGGWALPLLLVIAFRFDARGPSPSPLPDPVPSLAGRRVLVIASPPSQHGSWHGLQCAIPSVLGVVGAKGLFVEASPAAKAVFELERSVSPADRRPRWWAIRLDPEVAPPDTAAIRRRLRELGIDAVLSVEGISDDAAAALASPAVAIGGGFTMHLAAESAASRLDRDRIDVDLGGAGSTGETIVPVNPFPDWRVASGSGTISPTRPPAAPALVVRGHGPVTLRVGPRAEEWTGLSIGILAAGVVAASGAARIARHRRAGISGAGGTSSR